jgi:hypothetical protein
MDPSHKSHLTLYADGQSTPGTTDLSWRAQESVSNSVVVPVGADGRVDLAVAKGTADVTLDVTGWFTDSSKADATGSLYVPVSPTRICDTRAATEAITANQCDGTGAGTLAAGGTRIVQVTGLADVPSGATAAAISTTEIGPSTRSELTVYPDGVAEPTATAVSWSTPETISDLLIASLGSDGSVDATNLAGTTDLTMDVDGYYAAPSA